MCNGVCSRRALWAGASIGSRRRSSAGGTSTAACSPAGTGTTCSRPPRCRRRAQQGVRGRNSDNSLLRKVLGWEPSIMLREGLQRTYPWIEAELLETGSQAAVPDLISTAATA